MRRSLPNRERRNAARLDLFDLVNKFKFTGSGLLRQEFADQVKRLPRKHVTSIHAGDAPLSILKQDVEEDNPK